MNAVPRRWLARAPVLLTAYFAWTNRGRRGSRTALSAAFAFFVAWMASVSIYVHAHRAATISTLAWIHRHDLFWAALSAIVAAVLVSRRRALNQIAATRSWTAALPVERSTAKWQSIIIESIPAILLTCALAAIIGGLSLITLFNASIPAPTMTWAATTGGIWVGAGLSYLLPLARQEEIYESSRCVPHRRRLETPIPTGSFSALGSWPMRHMFASARPKTVARVMIPILLSVPLGSTAADAMLAIGVLAVIGALVLLVAAAISVNARASRWLRPLPIGSGLWARRILIPALAFMFCMTAIESWLIWVLGLSVARCIATGILSLVTSAIVAIMGSLFAIYATNKGTSDRL